jgi:ribosomal protein L37E
VHWEKWVAALGRCGKRRQDENKKYTSCGEFGPKELREYRKMFSNVQNLIFKQNLIEFK